MTTEFEPERFFQSDLGKGLLANEWFALSKHSARCTEGTIVEIGTYHGWSAVALAYGQSQLPDRSNGGVFCVDPHVSFTGVYGGRFGPRDRGEFYRTMLKTGFFDRVALINLQSIDAARGWNRPIGLLFIDGNHTEEAVRSDVAAWEPHVLQDGTIAFDDALDPAIGPAKVIGQLLESGRYEGIETVGKVTFLRKLNAHEV